MKNIKMSMATKIGEFVINAINKNAPKISPIIVRVKLVLKLHTL
jgi:hypothetical protein